MKYLVLIPDGMADEKVEALGGLSPMQKAHKPCMDALAKESLVGIVSNVPEGMVVISPLLLLGVSRWRTLFISLAIGGLEIVGVWIGYAAGAISQLLLPAMLAFAGGAMLYVVSDEMIPETHAHGYQKQATYALLIGFMTLMFIEGQM